MYRPFKANIFLAWGGGREQKKGKGFATFMGLVTVKKKVEGPCVRGIF